ncbi:atpase v1 complex subunit c [Lichtheimia corymbifera JMRC:FSU:9682]|uniref:V-type proton ATPase subunit C n=1 Tax=Lichtheimia corymbifera JMRC:FSU:9682 TaxID=1263082 RepID=A0A068S7Y9_9FUNG|nr:atpase v1 complex subunit c [Lichtheimia corymbifera JMRC:FSU:9682]
MKYLFISVPALGNKQNTFLNIRGKLSEFHALTYAFNVPEFKIGTLDALVLLSDDLAKHDTAFEQTVNKLADILTNLVKSDSTNGHVSEYMLVNDKPIEEYISTFQWNSMKYRTDKSLQETTATLSQEVSSIDTVMKNKMNAYSQNRNALQSLQRKQTGNLSVKSLNGIVKKEQCVLNSEYLTTLFVAVPKTAYKQWLNKYETLTSMVVPRSSVKIAEDDEYGLFSVTLFQRVADEFVHKAREERFIVRDFKYDEDALQKQKHELDETVAVEKEQQMELFRLARTNFGEYCATVFLLISQPLQSAKPKYEEKVDAALLAQYGRLGGVHGQAAKQGNDDPNHEELLDHDLQTVNDSSYRPYVEFHLQFDTERA